MGYTLHTVDVSSDAGGSHPFKQCLLRFVRSVLRFGNQRPPLETPQESSVHPPSLAESDYIGVQCKHRVRNGVEHQARLLKKKTFYPMS